MSAPPASSAQLATDFDAIVAEYQASRARYIRTVTSDAEKRLMETIGKRREQLRNEINNLTELARHRHDSYQASLRTYATLAPSRVTAAGMQPPSPSERMIKGIGKIYKAAVHAADEFREVDTIVKKRKEKLGEIDWKLRVKIEEYGRDLIAQLESDTGLEGAFRRDPLLGRAHARMVAATARRQSIRDCG